MRSHFVLSAAFAATLLYTTSSFAQSVAVDGVVVRSVKSGTLPERPDGVPAGAVTQADCQADEVLTIPLALSGSFLGAGLTLEAWAGEGTTDCTTLEARTAATASCWRIAGFTQSLPLAQQISVEVRAQDLVAQLGTPLPKVLGSSEATSSVCTSKLVTPGPHPVRAWFFFANDTNASGTGASLDLTAALSTTSILGDITVTAGPARLEVGIPPGQDASIRGYNLYCDATACGAPGGGAAPDLSFQCGHGSATETTILLDALTPGREYRIAAAPTDQWGNIGPITNTVCATPQAASSGAGASGGGGGGGCAVAPARADGGTGGGVAAFVAGLVALAGVLARRRVRTRTARA